MKLDQFLKWNNIVSSGGEAKMLIVSGHISVNGEIEKKRGRKLKRGDVIKFSNNEIIYQ
tara:strand:+ start:287 stop:463 length:177 start_codon:yes stop_codon:yes gene_type:complete